MMQDLLVAPATPIMEPWMRRENDSS